MVRGKPLAAFATLAGTIIGVGMFGIPYAVASVGFWPGIAMLGATTVVTLYLHAAFGEVVAAASSAERLGGYARRFLGTGAEYLANFVAIAGRVGALLAYLVVGSAFTATLLAPWIETARGAGFPVFFVIAALGVWFGVRFVSGIEAPLVFLLVAGVAALGWFALAHVRLEHLAGVRLGELPLLYGVLLFALGGIPAIPEVRSLVSDRAAYRRVLAWGTIVPAVVYALFTLAVVGVNGSATSPEAIAGLSRALGPTAALVGAGVGFLAVVTSFFVIGLNLAHILEYDWGWSRSASRLATLGAPVVLFGLGLNDFIRIIGTLGAVLGAAEGILVLMLFERWRAVPRRGRSEKKRASVLGIRSRWASVAVGATLVAGAVWYIAGIRTP